MMTGLQRGKEDHQRNTDCNWLYKVFKDEKLKKHHKALPGTTTNLNTRYVNLLKKKRKKKIRVL